MTLRLSAPTARIAGMNAQLDLPPLPEPGFDITNDRRMPTRVVSIADHGVYSAEQMRDYAAQAVIQERERCAKVVTDYEFPSLVPHDVADAEVAEAAGEVLRWQLLSPIADAVRQR